MNGTQIEYPIVKGTNNSYYLSHSFNKEYNIAGWVFADYRNKVDGTDKNIIVYGHHMKNGTMFGTLVNVVNKEWYEVEDNHELIFVSENERALYQVFSVYQIEAKNYDNKVEFSGNNEFLDYVISAKNRSVYDFGVDVNISDRILTLSTCAKNDKYRIVLHAKKVY